MAAQRFLESNDLPTTYVDQVVQFIEKNTSGVNLGSSEEFVDPYTGSFVQHNVTCSSRVSESFRRIAL